MSTTAFSGEMRTATADTSRSPMGFKNLEVAPSRYYTENRGLQAGLIHANSNFIIHNNPKEKDIILERLLGSIEDRYGWDAIAKASREERNLSGNKQRKPEWKIDMTRWLGEMKSNVPAAYELDNKILQRMLHIPLDQVGFSDNDLDNLAKYIRNPAEGMRMFVSATISVEGIATNPEMMMEVQNLAEVLFGGKISGTVVTQIASLESALKHSDKSKLASELFNQGVSISPDENPEAVFLINELQKLITSNTARQKRLQQKITDKETTNLSPPIAHASILGGRPEQQDYTLVSRSNLPKGIESISILTDGHGKDGKKAGAIGAQFFEAKLVDIMNGNPTISVESAIKQAINYADKQVINVATEGGGAAFVAAIKVGKKIYIVNVGDCRAHQISPEGKFKTLTTDHRWEAEGKEKYRWDIQLSRTLGNGAQKEQSGGEITAIPDITVLEDVPQGTRLVLVSDGVTLSQPEFSGLIRGKSAREGVDGIMRIMNRKDPSDNVSTIVIEV